MSKYTLGDYTIKNWNSWDRVPRDPFTVGAAILSGTGIAAGLSGAAAFYGAYIVGYLATTAITSWAISALTPKPDFGALDSSGILVNRTAGIAPQDFIYGEVRKGGIVTFYETTGSDNVYLHQIICLAGHEVNSIGDVYINDQVATFSGNFVTTAGTGSEQVNWDSKIRIKKYDGSQTTADSDLVSETSVTSSFKGLGIAYLYVRYEYDQDVFVNGLPVVTAVVQGKKVYDPRTTSTGYSSNAALCVRDFLTSSYGLSDSAIDDVSFSAAANECDENVTLSGGSTEKRYALNGVVQSNRAVGDVLGDMVTACAGTLFWGSGYWKLKAGAYSSPVKTLTLDDLRSPISLDTRITMRDNFNTVRGTFVDASQGWISADYPEVTGAAFVTEDNGEQALLDLQLPFTTSSATAQRLAKLTLFRGREQMTFSADFGLEALEVEVGDIIGITNARYSFTAKEFEVVGWKFASNQDAGDLRVTLTLRETSAAAFNWNAEETDIISNNTTLPSITAGTAITNLALSDGGSEVQGDGTVINSLIASWTAPTNAFVSHYEIEWGQTSSANRTTFISSDTSALLSPVVDGVSYTARVRSVSVSSFRGAYSTATATSGGDTTAPDKPTTPTVIAGVKQLEINWEGYSSPVDFQAMEVYHSTSSGGTFTKIGASAGTNIVHGGLVQNSTHYYKIKARDFSGNLSIFSDESNGTVAADVQGPAGQSGLIITLNGSDIYMNNENNQGPTVGTDPRPNNSATQTKLDNAFVEANPLLAQMSDIPQNSVVWARFVFIKNQSFTTTSGQTLFTVTGGHTPDSQTKIIYDGNRLISGDFVSASVDGSGNSASISFTDQFLNRFNLTTVPSGKAVDITYIQASARSWGYSSQDWTDNSSTFDSPAIFSPLVLSKDVLTQSLAANEITADQLIINKDVDLLDGAAWRIGKSDYSDITDGIFFGNPSGTGATNYAFAFSATSNSGQSTEHGIEITPQQTKLIQPLITKQATGAVAISDKQTTQTITIKNGSTNPNAQTVTINAIGGGGGGAGAESQSGSAGAGGNTTYTLSITGGSQAGTYNVTALGGAAGSGFGAAITDGDSGASSARASGGFGGGAGQTGGSGSLGSGGGGGGGRDASAWTTPRAGGAGGGAGSHVSNSYDISGATSVSLSISSIGSGGSGMSSSRGNGGSGGTGVLYGTIQTSGLDPVVLKTETEYNLGVIGDGQLYSSFTMGQNTVYTNNGPKPVFISVQEGTAGGGTGFLYARGSSSDSYEVVGRRKDNNQTEILGCAVIPVGGSFYKTNHATSTTCSLLGVLS